MKTNCFLLLSFITLLLVNVSGQQKPNEQLFNHAKLAPDSVENNISSLAAYLKDPAYNDRETVECIFYWMAMNISYYENPSDETPIKDSIAVMTLRDKRSGCEGTARLFNALCNAAGIECAMIFGYAEGYSFDGKRSPRPNHGWNAVRLDGKWELADATWGSGGATTEGDSLVYVTQLDMRYLFPDPEDFIIDHFPEDAKWQLLDNPISRREFYSDEYELKRMAKLGW
jgi:transglutaminase/protease-like cytokinesis protein 3